MSRYHCSSTPTQVLHDIQIYSSEQLIELYGIEINEDGTVFDPAENKTFATIIEWATWIDEQEADDNYGTLVKLGGKVRFDDD